MVGFPKVYMKWQSAIWASYLLFVYQDLNIYYVPIGCVFIAINPEGPIRSLGLAEE